MSLPASAFILPLERELADLNDFEDFCGVLASALSERGAPLILLLSGEMGAGKTTLVALLAERLGGQGAASPTYALHHRYELENSRHLDHWDLYRVEDESELDSAGFWEILEFEQDLWAVEWPERVAANYWPRGKELWSLEISKTATGGRLVKIRKGL